jgi:hypothetical protein
VKDLLWYAVFTAMVVIAIGMMASGCNVNDCPCNCTQMQAKLEWAQNRWHTYESLYRIKEAQDGNPTIYWESHPVAEN